MMWLKNHVNDNDVIAVDRHYILKPEEGDSPAPDDASRYYYYSAYSTKQLFLEGWAWTPRTDEMREKIINRFKINESLYVSTNVSTSVLMTENNIKYILVSRFIHPDLKFDDARLEEVFKNRDITIYKLIDNPIINMSK